MDSDVNDPCVAMRNVPTSANTTPMASLRLGRRRICTHETTRMRSRLSDCSTVAVPASLA